VSPNPRGSISRGNRADLGGVELRPPPNTGQRTSIMLIVQHGGSKALFGEHSGQPGAQFIDRVRSVPSQIEYN